MQSLIPLSEIACASDTAVQNTKYLHGPFTYGSRNGYHVAENKFQSNKSAVATIAESA